MKSLSVALLVALSLAGCASQQLPARHEVTGSSTTDAAQAASLISAYRVSRGLSAVRSILGSTRLPNSRRGRSLRPDN